MKAIKVGCLHSIEPEEDTDAKDPPDMMGDQAPPEAQAEKNESGGGEPKAGTLGHKARGPVQLLLENMKDLLNVSQIGVTFHGICPPTFIQT